MDTGDFDAAPAEEHTLRASPPEPGVDGAEPLIAGEASTSRSWPGERDLGGARAGRRVLAMTLLAPLILWLAAITTAVGRTVEPIARVRPATTGTLRLVGNAHGVLVAHESGAHYATGVRLQSRFDFRADGEQPALAGLTDRFAVTRDGSRWVVRELEAGAVRANVAASPWNVAHVVGDLLVYGEAGALVVFDLRQRRETGRIALGFGVHVTALAGERPDEVYVATLGGARAPTAPPEARGVGGHRAPAELHRLRQLRDAAEPTSTRGESAGRSARGAAAARREPHGLVRVDPTSGAVVWWQPLEHGVDTPPVVTADTVVVATNAEAGAVLLLERATGRERARRPMSHPFYVARASRPISAGTSRNRAASDTVYVTAGAPSYLERNVFAISARDGAVRWRHAVRPTGDARGKKAAPLVSVPVVTGDAVVVGVDDELRVLDVGTGAVRDAIPLGTKLVADPVLVDGLVVLATRRGELRAYAVPSR